MYMILCHDAKVVYDISKYMVDVERVYDSIVEKHKGSELIYWLSSDYDIDAVQSYDTHYLTLCETTDFDLILLGKLGLSLSDETDVDVSKLFYGSQDVSFFKRPKISKDPTTNKFTILWK